MSSNKRTRASKAWPPRGVSKLEVFLRRELEQERVRTGNALVLLRGLRDELCSSRLPWEAYEATRVKIDAVIDALTDPRPLESKGVTADVDKPEGEGDERVAVVPKR